MTRPFFSFPILLLSTSSSFPLHLLFLSSLISHLHSLLIPHLIPTQQSPTICQDRPHIIGPLGLGHWQIATWTPLLPCVHSANIDSALWLLLSLSSTTIASSHPHLLPSPRCRYCEPAVLASLELRGLGPIMRCRKRFKEDA